MKKILGVVLARDEDIFLGRALKNASAFCDEFLLFDHGSRDATLEIMREFAAKHPRAKVRQIAHPRESQEELARRAGEPWWVFGVDGDEVYDPLGLARLRPLLLNGTFDEWWMVMGHCLHAESWDEEAGRAQGWMAPPSRSVTKLYNFAAIESWEGESQERLHGGQPVFRPGYSADKKKRLQEEMSWEDSPLRCLHLCFCRRSRMEKRGGARQNIAEMYGRLLPPGILRALGRVFPSSWKTRCYRRGPLLTLETKAFSC